MNEFDDHSGMTELDALPREMTPPSEVEERVVRELRRRGLIADRRSRRPGAWLQLAAAALIAAVLGWTGRGLIEPARPQAATGHEFLLLLSEPVALQTTKSEAELVQEYRSWASNLGHQASLVHSAKLRDGGQLLRGSLAARQSPAPVGGLDSITGYFQVRASSWEEALRIARSCPHLTYGGEISVRMLEQI